jgi:hypothetical protein
MDIILSDSSHFPPLRTLLINGRQQLFEFTVSRDLRVLVYISVDIIFFPRRNLQKVLDMFSFGWQTRVMFNKHAEIL